MEEIEFAPGAVHYARGFLKRRTRPAERDVRKAMRMMLTEYLGSIHLRHGSVVTWSPPALLRDLSVLAVGPVQGQRTIHAIQPVDRGGRVSSFGIGLDESQDGLVRVVSLLVADDPRDEAIDPVTLAWDYREAYGLESLSWAFAATRVITSCESSGPSAGRMRGAAASSASTTPARPLTCRAARRW